MIPFFKPRQIPMEDIQKELNNVLESGQYSNSLFCRALESKIKEMYNVKYAITCSSCSQGLMMLVNYFRDVLEFTTIGLPSFTWESTLKAIKINFLEPLYLDINPHSWLLDYDTTNFNLPALLMVDTFGNKSNLNEFEADFPIIYDSAQSLGVSGIGNRGLAEVFSLAPSKMLTGMEGGIITTNYDNVAQHIIKLRDITSRLEEFNALIALWHLNKLKEIQKHKQEVVKYYQDNLPWTETQSILHETNYNVFGGLIDNSQKIINKLSGKIELRKYYTPLWPFRAAQFVYTNILCLPSYYGVDYEKVVKEIKKVI